LSSEGDRDKGAAQKDRKILNVQVMCGALSGKCGEVRGGSRGKTLSTNGENA